MAAILKTHVAAQAPSPALIDEEGVTTWTQLDERVNRWINALRAAGVTKGERVALMSRNRREAWELFIGCLHAGFVALPVNWELGVSEVRHILQHSGARALVVDEGAIEAAAPAVAGLPLRLRAVFGGEDLSGFESSEALLARSSAEEPTDQVSGGTMFYTSGTTGRPKGVLAAGATTLGAPLDALAGSVHGVCSTLGFPAGGNAMIVGPNYHSGQFVLSSFPILFGQTLVIRRAPDPVDILETIDRLQVTNVLLLPADFAALLQLPAERRDAFDGASLEVVLHGGAPTPPEVKRRMIEWLGPRLVEYYGATEGGLFALSSSEDWRRRPESVGRVLPFMEVRVVDEAGEPVPVGQAGRLYFRHRAGAEFQYHNDPEKTAAAYLEPGLFTVGDIGYLDEDGYLYVTGRESEMIPSGGRSVSPGKVEAALAAHPAVADVAAFGAAVGERGEEVRAAIVLHSGVTASPELAEELRARAAGVLDEPEVPSHIDFLDALPRSAAGKILRAALRDQSARRP